MNPDLEPELQAIEDRLRQLSPAEPSEQLSERIFASFDTPADAGADSGDEADKVTPLPKPASWFQPFAAAAVVALLAGAVAIIGLSLSPDKKPVAAQPERFIPESAENIYEGSKLEPIVFTENRQPVQPVRHRFVESYIWTNPEDGSKVEIRIPVERIRYIDVPTD